MEPSTAEQFCEFWLDNDVDMSSEDGEALEKFIL
jgi:hypothetical protein